MQPIFNADLLGDTVKPRGNFANVNSANGKGLNLLLQGATFKSAISLAYSQVKAVRIVIPPNDSVYVWKGHGGDELWYKFFAPDSSVVISFIDSDRTISEIRTMCGRGSCPDGFEINFHSNGLIASKGQYGYTTNIDSLKNAGGDGFLDYVGKTGWWYYWNDNGFLIRKEKWVKDKLMQTINFNATISRTSRRKH